MEAAPFTLTPGLDLASLNRRHRVVFEGIVEGLNQGQSLVALLGEAGLGKIALLRYALENNNVPKYKIILIDASNIQSQSSIHFDSIIKAIYQEIGYESKHQSSVDTLMDLHDIFLEEQKKDSNLVIIIDHAHLLPDDVLHSMPKLIDVYPHQQPLAQMVLVGEPDLNQALQHANLRQLKKRIQLIGELAPFNYRESLAYIQHKLAAASSTGGPPVLSNAAMRRIAKAANGIPRTLNMLCTDVMVAGYAERSRPISVNVVKQVLADFPMRRAPWASRLAWVGAAAMLFAALAAGFAYRAELASQAQRAARLPQQVSTRLRPLLADLKPQTTTPLTPAPTEAPPTRPAQPPVSKVEPPAQAPVEAPSVTPAQRPSTEAMPPAKVGGETPSSPSERAMQGVAALIDQHFPQGGAFGLKVWSNKAPGETYVDGERLVLHVAAETPAFLWIDYYQADGQIVRLLPHPLISNQTQAGQRFTLGGAGNAFQFTVAPPFGMEMLTVVASQTPIDLAAGTAVGAAGDLDIDDLSRRLQTYGSQGKAAAAYVRIRTQPRGAARPQSTGLQPLLQHGKP